MGCAELSCLHVCLLSSEVKDLVPHISLLTNKASLHVLISSLLHCLACFLWCPLPTTSIPAKRCKVISKYSVEYLISKQQGPCIPRGTHSPYGQDKKKTLFGGPCVLPGDCSKPGAVAKQDQPIHLSSSVSELQAGLAGTNWTPLPLCSWPRTETKRSSGKLFFSLRLTEVSFLFCSQKDIRSEGIYILPSSGGTRSFLLEIRSLPLLHFKQDPPLQR